MLEVESGTVSSGNEPSIVKVSSFLPVKIVMEQMKSDASFQGMDEPFNK